MPLPKILNENKKSLALLIYTVVVPIVASITISLLIINYGSALSSLATWQIVLCYIVATVTMALGITPTTFIAICGGFLLGWASLPLMILAYTVAAFIGFSLAKQINQERFMETLSSKKKLHGTLSRLKNSASLTFMVRLSPVLPFAMTNVLLAILNTPLRTFITWGSLGMLPRTILFTWIGSQLGSLILYHTALSSPLYQWISISLLLLTSLAIGWIVKRASLKI